MYERGADTGDGLQEKAGAAENGCAGATGDGHCDVNVFTPGGDKGAARRGHGAVMFQVPNLQVAGGVGRQQGILVFGFRLEEGEGEAFAGEAGGAARRRRRPGPASSTA